MNVKYRAYKILVPFCSASRCKVAAAMTPTRSRRRAPTDERRHRRRGRQAASATDPSPRRADRGAREGRQRVTKRRRQPARRLQRHAEDEGQKLPAVLEATGGTDMVTNLPPDFALRSSALEPRSRATANLNPFTTLALATAEQMGDGATTGNIRTALATARRNSTAA